MGDKYPGEIREVFTYGDLIRALIRRAAAQEEAQNPEAITSYRQAILANTLPTPDQTEAMIDAARQFGRLEALRELAEGLTPDELRTTT